MVERLVSLEGAGGGGESSKARQGILGCPEGPGAFCTDSGSLLTLSQRWGGPLGQGCLPGAVDHVRWDGP